MPIPTQTKLYFVAKPALVINHTKLSVVQLFVELGYCRTHFMAYPNKRNNDKITALVAVNNVDIVAQRDIISGLLVSSSLSP